MREFLRGPAVFFFVCFLFLSLSSSAEDGLAVDIVDVGAGSCTVVTLPHKNGILLFDAGNWRGKHCYSAVKQAVSNLNTNIKLMVVSHSDADHLGDAASILKDFEVSNLVRTGFTSSSKSWEKFDAASIESASRGTLIYSAAKQQIAGTQFLFGDVAIRILYGKSKWDGAPLSSSGARNAISVVAKLEYAGRSILIPGDTIGRDIGGASDQCAYAESEMVLNAEKLRLASDIMIAPHHGSDSSSSSCFIDAVSPQYVIFQAGHKHGHPTISAKDRYLAAGVKLQNIFRTDRGDSESSPFDWESDVKSSCKDKAGDDAIHIAITANGEISINYINPEPSSCS